MMEWRAAIASIVLYLEHCDFTVKIVMELKRAGVRLQTMLGAGGRRGATDVMNHPRRGEANL